MPERRDKSLMKVVVGGQVLFLVLLAAMATLALMRPATEPVAERPVVEEPIVERTPAEKPPAEKPPAEIPIVEISPPRDRTSEPRRQGRKPVVTIPRDAPVTDDGEVYPLLFPIAEDGARLTASFGDPRSGERSHEGEDIMAPKMTPVVAAAEGVVIWLHDEEEGRRSCCALTLLHGDGWRTRYIHLNNDTPGTDDGRAYGIAPGLEVGSEVAAGDLIGWVGDSGNAEHTAPHLHFELRRPDGEAVDPFPSLLAAVTVAD